MKNTLLVVTLILCTLVSSAQKDSLQSQILNYSDSDREILTKGRGLLGQKLIEGDYEKVKELRAYLQEKYQGKDYLPFYPQENIFIFYWTREYKELIANIINLDSLNRWNPWKLVPPRDLLLEQLYNLSRDSVALLENFIHHSELSSTDRDFLLLYLKYITLNSLLPETRDSVNHQANEFLSAHPGSPYEQLTRNGIRQQYILSKWGWGVEFFSGYGIFTDSLKRAYSNNIPIGVAFDIYYKRWALYLRDYIGFSKTQTDIPYNNGNWKKGSQVRVFLPEVSIGYVALENDFWRIAPFGGFSWMDIGPTQYDLNRVPDLEKAELKFATTYTTGLQVDIKLGKSKTPMVSMQEKSYWFLRLRYAYNWPQFERKYSDVTGNMHYLTVGIGGFGRRLKRDY